ncbi:type II secretion system F family protein [candidate division NPL-UPA2 bacterium]|nr:type II secretion system F family protein [candidate division NPL-UPA2 bacterium]
MLETIILGVLFISAAAILLVFKNKYKEEIDRLDKKDFPLKDFLTIGYFALELVKYRFTTLLDGELKEKCSQLFGAKEADFYLRTHWANTITLAMIINQAVFFYLIVMEAHQPLVVIIAILLGLPVLTFFLLKSELDKKIARRHLLLRMDFVEILNKLILLVNSGMIVTQAMSKIVEDNPCTRPLYREVKLAMAEIKGGKPEVEAYEAFAKRCRVPEIFRFTLLIIQNMRKGSVEFVSALRLQSNESWLMRKSVAKELSEEATTKLLFPMMFMFVAIILIVMTPAILSMMAM